MHKGKKRLVLRVSELDDGTSHMVLEDDPEVLGISPDYCVFEGPVIIEMDLEKNGTELGILAKVKAHAVSECSRCLGEVHHEIDSEVAVKCAPMSTGFSEPVLELGRIEIPYSGDEIDLSFLARDETVLHIGMKPLCSPGCKGLCPQCGADLNNDECDCKIGEIDPRWEILRRMSQ